MKLELDKELQFQPLAIRGTFPSWLQGTLFRNGPVLYTIDGQYPVHWFDGLGMLHAFKIERGTVHYTNKFIQSEAVKNPPHYLGFACDPCHVLFKKIFTAFLPHAIHNANVNIAKYAESFVGLTETPLPVVFDPNTLETLGVFDFEDSLAKSNVFESAHPHYNTLTGDTINYIVKYGVRSYYQVYNLQQSSRKLLFEFPVQNPSYMHTFSLTENYVIFAEYPFTVRPLDMLFSSKPFIMNYKWQKDMSTRFLFINRHTGKLAFEHEIEPFFSFHHINAYEHEDHVILDLIAYPDASIIETLGKYGQPDYTSAVNQGLSSTKLIRFSFGDKHCSKEVLFSGAIEFPRINPHYDAHPYRYFYGADIRENQGGSIYKMDFRTKNLIAWQEDSCYPGEPVFIPHPQKTEEDSGLIVSVLFNQKQNSSELLLLDATTFQEVARASIPIKIPLGLHGQFYPQVIFE